jgi:virginiamycin B lyase
LDPTTGAVQTWTLPAPASGVRPTPFALAVTRDGQVWFGNLTGGAIGRLDPETGHVTLYRLAEPQAQVFAMASDGRGRVWFTELNTGRLGSIETAIGRVTEYEVPSQSGQPGGLYGIGVAASGEVWFASLGAHAIVRYTPDTSTFTFFQLPLATSVPYGLAFDAAGDVWFTAGGSSANYVGELRA